MAKKKGSHDKKNSKSGRKSGRKSGSKSDEGGIKKKHSKYLFFLFFLAVLVMAVYIVRPFLTTLAMSAILAYVFYPVYKYFYRLTGMKGFSALVLIVMILLVSLIPLLVVTGELTKESYSMYSKAKSVFLTSGNIEEACASDEGLFCSIYNTWDVLSEKYDLDFHLARGFSSVASSFVGRASDFILNIPQILLKIFISLFAMFYMLTQGEDMVRSVRRALPLSEEHSKRILNHFNDIIHATIYGAIVISVVQGSVAGVGYLIFGVDSPILLALLTIVAAFLPFVGGALVWVPVSLTVIINGAIADDQTMLLKGVGLFIYGALLVSTLDNLLRPKIVGDRAKVHPLVILLGVFGGLALFGFTGIMIGPLLLTLFIASLRIYEEEKENIMQ